MRVLFIIHELSLNGAAISLLQQVRRTGRRGGANERRPPSRGPAVVAANVPPPPEQMDFPTLWVLTGEGEKPAPWGVEMRLEV